MGELECGIARRFGILFPSAARPGRKEKAKAASDAALHDMPGSSSGRQGGMPDLRLLALLVVLIGVAWRLTRYLLRFPVWGDEAMLLVNYPGRDYLDLAGPLENCQVAPLLFHWAELTALRLFGTSDLAVRVPPLLACL